MIDLHCHILPGLDDGPKTAEGSLKLAAAAIRNGIHTVVATPHHATRRYHNSASKIRKAVDRMNERLRLRSMPLTVLPGQEFRLHPSYLSDYDRGKLQTLADSMYLLVELPSRAIPPYFNEFAEWMSRSRLQIVIAHPERNLEVVERPELLLEWRERGIFLQVTSQSLLGLFGRRIQRTAAIICKRKWAHMLASDAHNTLQRGFYLRQGYETLKQLGGADYARCLQRNAERLIRGQTVVSCKHPLDQPINTEARDSQWN
ncbi:MULTISPECIES: tyrosine-protein phosphatase [unclassified Paenibacillus]|uniref:tyrosine-protein phosphatase n=1 Tax=unclassified Paenibacillus TaxID=185978 RepID=UPI001C0F463D|nr:MULTISPECIES: CpsB/CapC family capsule biosynthesis tyrosine phosphatase [unclassified Paenibacillus]MBU5443478.1 hypothetical protein [Paenibacillus sp. MSJ-34]